MKSDILNEFVYHDRNRSMGHLGTFMGHTYTVEDKDVIRSYRVVDSEDKIHEQKTEFEP